VDAEQARSLHDKGGGTTEIARKLGTEPASVYRALKDPLVTTM
jgi:DNA invertase Pin-like site-specific DNA recombinase